jgi:hypothetical protein
MRSHLIFAAALATGFVACNKTAEETGTLVPVETQSEGPGGLPDPDQQGGHIGRAPRRLTVAQLGQSIQIAAGRPWASLDALAPSLGRADFALVNSESAEPTLVFAKFLEDGAREVCQAAATADLGQTTAANRVLARQLPDNISNLTTLTDAQVRTNLVYLSTRFWGEPLVGEELAAWLDFFKKAATRAQAVNRRDQAFAAVCIALMTDPRFITY